MRSQIVIKFPGRALEGLAVRPVLGVPLFLRTCLTLAELGLQDIIVVAPGHLRRSIVKAWQHHAQSNATRLELLSLDADGQMESADVHRFRSMVHSRYCILDATTVVTAHWCQEVLRPALRYGRPLRGIGQLVQTQAGAKTPLPTETHGMMPIPAPRPGAYFQVTTASDLPALETFLSEHIRHGANGVIAKHLNKRISLPMSRIMARLRISPNAITVFNMLVGLAAGIGTAGRTYVGLLCGALLFQCASILDGCDGEVAKLTHRTSKFGQMIDTISDNFSLVAFFIGLTIHHWRVDTPFAIGWGLLLIAGIATILAMMFGFLRKYTDSSSLVTFHKEFLDPAMQQIAPRWQPIIGLFKGMMKKEWYSLLFLGVALIGWLPNTLFIVTGIVWTGVGAIWVLQRQYAWGPTTQRIASTNRKRAHGISAP